MHKVVAFFSRLVAVAAVVALASCASEPSAKKEDSAATSRRPEPVWVVNPRMAYPDALYVAAVGSGPDRETAEKAALSALVQVFGQDVVGSTTVSARYAEAVKNGEVLAAESTEIARAISASASMDTLVGAEIRDVWADASGATYAVAVLDRAKATMLYGDLIAANETTIDTLIDVPAAERETLDAYARLSLAAEVADANGKFLNLLSVVNPAAAAAKRGRYPNGDQLRVERMKIAQNIPIGVRIDGDREGRVRAAFTAAITAAGFKAGGESSRYLLDGRLTLSGVDLPDNPNVFVRYLVDASLVDRSSGSVLLPYSANGREGHRSLGEAEQRALREAERKIREDYGTSFAAYLSRLATKR